jgi:lipid A ethanolaminephosphotransferase
LLDNKVINTDPPISIQARNTLFIIVKILSVAILLFYTEHYAFLARSKELFFNYGYLGDIAFFALWVISIVALLLTAFLPNIYIRSFFTIVIFITTLIGTSYLKISGSPLFYDNLYILIENLNYTDSALDHYAKEILPSLFIASLSFLFLLPSPGVFKKNLSKHVKSAIYFIAVIPFLLIFLLALLRGGYGVEETPMQYRLSALLAIIGLESMVYGSNERSLVEYPIQKNSHLNVVLIVDESIRGDYLDIDCDSLGLTPYVFDNKDRILNFGYASSGGNCSAESNQILRTGANINDFELTFKTNPYIWQYARIAGYKTVMIEGQAKKGTLNNRMNKEEISHIDKFIYAKGKSSYQKDIYIAELITTLISEKHDKPYFILAVKKGLHFPYDRKVPQERRKYDTKSNGFNIGEREDLINSYKNAIAYFIDPFFKVLMENANYKNTVLFYTSDHGQNLLDNGHKITHCTTSDTSPYEGLVPLFIITDNQVYRDKFNKAALKNRDKSSHFNIFPTILNIFGFDKLDISRRHGVTLFDDISDPRKFTSGLLTTNRLRIGNRNTIKWNYLPDSFFSCEMKNAPSAAGPEPD